jgi:hypothetical protein
MKTKSLLYAAIISLNAHAQIFVTNKPLMPEDTAITESLSEIGYGKDAYYCLIKIADTKFDLLSRQVHIAHFDNKLEKYKEGFLNAPIWVGQADNQIKITVKLKGEDEFSISGIVINSKVDGSGTNYIFIDLLPKLDEKSFYPSGAIANSFTEYNSFFNKVKNKISTPSNAFEMLKKSSGFKASINVEYTNKDNQTKTIEHKLVITNEGNTIEYGPRKAKIYKVGAIPEEYKDNSFNEGNTKGHTRDELITAFKKSFTSQNIEVKYFSLFEYGMENILSGVNAGKVAGYRIKCLSVYQRDGKCFYGAVSFFYRNMNGNLEKMPDISRNVTPANTCD